MIEVLPGPLEAPLRSKTHPLTLILPTPAALADDLIAAAIALDAAAADAEALAGGLRQFVDVLAGEKPHPDELGFIAEQVGQVVARLHEAQGRLLFG